MARLTKVQKAQARAAMDAETMTKMEALCNMATLEQLLELCEKTLKVSAMTQRVLVERFGMEEWRKFSDRIQGGRL